MSVGTPVHVPQSKQTAAFSKSIGLQVALSPWLWGLGVTIAFYTVIELWPVWPAWVERYFCMHWTEYVLMTLSFVGLAILAIKALTVSWEWSAFRRVRNFGIDDSCVPLETRFAQLQQQVETLETQSHETYWGIRLRHLLTYFRAAPSSAGTSDHIAYLTEASADRMFASYALMNTIVWAVPIIGFLGTVMGITLAIANLTPDKLDTALNMVTRDLALAFDTTAIALTSSLVLGFVSLFVKRSEEQLLTEIDERCRLEIHRCFPGETEHSPLLEAQGQVALKLLDQTDQLLDEQTSLWRNTIEDFRDRWGQLVEQQQAQFAVAMDASTAATAGNHAQQLQAFRAEFVAAYSAVSESLLAEVVDREQQRTAANRELRETLDQFAHNLQQGLTSQLERQHAGTEHILQQLAHRLASFQQSLDGWGEQFGQLSQSTTQHTLQLHQQTATLSQLVGSESALQGLQHRLNENLEAVRTAETFDETLHNLTAAVHMLTARARAA